MLRAQWTIECTTGGLRLVITALVHSIVHCDRIRRISEVSGELTTKLATKFTKTEKSKPFGCSSLREGREVD